MTSDADTQGAIAYNRRRLMFDGALVASLGQVAGEPVLTEEVRAAGQIDAAFVRLVRAAQTRVLPPDAPRDGRLGQATIRSERARPRPAAAPGRRTAAGARCIWEGDRLRNICRIHGGGGLVDSRAPRGRAP